MDGFIRYQWKCLFLCWQYQLTFQVYWDCGWRKCIRTRSSGQLQVQLSRKLPSISTVSFGFTRFSHLCCLLNEPLKSTGMKQILYWGKLYVKLLVCLCYLEYTDELAQSFYLNRWRAYLQVDCIVSLMTAFKQMSAMMCDPDGRKNLTDLFR